MIAHDLSVLPYHKVAFQPPIRDDTDDHGLRAGAGACLLYMDERGDCFVFLTTAKGRVEYGIPIPSFRHSVVECFACGCSAAALSARDGALHLWGIVRYLSTAR